MESADLIRPDRRAAIQEVVDRIHAQLRFNAPPFPFEEFLQQNELYRVFEVELPSGVDGNLSVLPHGERIVHLRKDNPRPRVRFTLAHEILHAELHLREGKLCDNKACRTSDRFRDGSRSLEEREADFGAAALLIPLRMLDRYLAPHGRTGSVPPNVIARLARIFRVSERTMRIQIALYQDEYGVVGASSHADANPAP